MQHGPSMHTGKQNNVVTYDIALKRKQQVAEATFAFTFEKPQGFHYQAGQHAQLSLINPSETDSEGNGRLLSFVSTPQEPDLVFAMRMRDTAFKRVLSRMKLGEKVRLRMRLGNNPHGSFALRESNDATQPFVFLIGGIGIVPAFSIIKEALEKNQTNPLFLFYANRRPEDAPFLSELQALAKKHPSFTFVATMTGLDASTTKWQGETGRINQTMLKRYIENLQTPLYYIAGLPPMAAAMQDILARIGVKKESIRAEEFEGFAMTHHTKDATPRHTHNRPLRIGLLGVLLITLIVFIHANVGTSLSHAHTGVLAAYPLSVLLLGHALLATLAVGLFKRFISPKFHTSPLRYKR